MLSKLKRACSGATTATVVISVSASVLVTAAGVLFASGAKSNKLDTAALDVAQAQREVAVLKNELNTARMETAASIAATKQEAAAQVAAVRSDLRGIEGRLTAQIEEQQRVGLQTSLKIDKLLERLPPLR